ncbi:MAG: DUF5683 domain-containing protein [Aquaticitalea sp.]
MLNKLVHTLFCCLISFVCFSQIENDSIREIIPKELVVTEEILTESLEIDPLTPAKAAFYSAILPGLGQVYNKKYWKVPIAVGGIAAGIYFYQHNDKQYDRYRDAYKRRLAGYDDDEFQNVTLDGLQRAQKTLKQNKELSLLITFGIYALNIIDANVDAHLLQYNVDENLALKPHFQYNEQENATDLGLTLNFKF